MLAGWLTRMALLYINKTNRLENALENAALRIRKDAATPRGVGVMCDFYADRVEIAELWDGEGRRIIDLWKHMRLRQRV